MSTKNVANGMIMSFDVFDKKDIEEVNSKVTETLKVTPTNNKMATFHPSGSIETENSTWVVDSSSEFLSLLRNLSENGGSKFDAELVKHYVRGFQVQGHKDPRFPYYILIAKINLSSDALNSSKTLRDDLLQVSRPIRLFIESLGGFTNRLSIWTPKASLVAQLWIKVDKTRLSKITEVDRSFFSKDEEAIKSFEEREELSERMRKLEPFDLSDPVGDIHSHILNGSNVSIILGHMHQLALSGLRTPYLLYLSYDDKLLQSEISSDPHFMQLFPNDLGGIILQGYSYLIGLISMWIYLSSIAIRSARIDSQLSILRESTALESGKKSTKQIERYFSEISQNGTEISSLLGNIGIFARTFEGRLHQIAQGKGTWVTEVPVGNPQLIQSLGIGTYESKGYLQTLSEQILYDLHNIRASLEKQEAEITSLRLHISDFVNMENIRSNNTLQKKMYWIAVFALIVAIASSFAAYQSWNTAEMDYQRTHPQGVFRVTIYYFGYDQPRNRDTFRIAITYQGTGEARFLRLSVGIVGANPEVLSIGNAEVMEPDTVLARNYVDGLIGWVDYEILRDVSMNTTRIAITNSSSDVAVTVVDNTGLG